MPTALLLCALALPAHSPHDVIAAWAISPDFERDRTLFVSLPRFSLFLRSQDAGATFRVASAGLHTGHVVALAVSPDFARDRRAWCAETRALFRSLDGGERWERVALPDGLEGARLESIAVSPAFAADGTLAVAAGEHGLWVSRDRGGDFERATAGGVESAWLSADFARDGRAWAAAQDGALLASTDGARSFAPVAVPPRAALAFAADGATWWLGTRGQGLWRSDDAGARWSPDAPGLAAADVTHVSLARDARGAPVVFVASAQHGVWVRGGDGGWRTSSEGLRENSDQTFVHHFGTFASPAFARDRTVFLASFEGLYVSEEAGDGWRWIDVLGRRLVRNLALSPAFADDRTLWLSTYGSGLVEVRCSERDVPARSGVRAAEGAPGAAAAREPAFACRLRESRGWLYPDAVAASPGRAGSRALLVATPGQLLRSGDDGDSAEIVIESEKGFARALAFAPDFERSGLAFAHLPTYLGTRPRESRCARSADGGRTWQDIELAATADVAFAPDWAESGRLYAACDDGLFVSRDRGLSFERLPALEARPLESVAAAPGAAGDVLLVASRHRGLALSRDGGATFAPLVGASPALGFHCVELSPDFERDGLAFAGPSTDGVHATRDGGTTWERAPGGPDAVLALARSPTFARDATLVAGGYEGAWISSDAARTWTPIDFPAVAPRDPEARTKLALLVLAALGVAVLAAPWVRRLSRARTRAS